MDPLSVQARNTLVLRPGAITGSDLAHVLERGRVVAGEVLQRLDGGSILIGIGRHRVPAQSEVELAPGERFLVRVDQQDGKLVLRMIVAQDEDVPSALIAALRGSLGASRPLGDALSALMTALRAQPEGGATPEALASLRQALSAHVFAPGGDGVALAQVLKHVGISYEAQLAALAFARATPEQRARVGEQLQRWIVGDASAPQPELARAWTDALWNELGKLWGVDAAAARASASGATLAGAVEDLRGLLLRALASLPRTPERDALAARVRRLDLALLSRPERQLALASLLGLAESAVDAPPARAASAALVDAELKAELLRAKAELGDTPAAKAVEQAIVSLEAEQLLNLARGESDEPRQWSFPVLDGARWTTAHLTHRLSRDRSGGSGSDGEEIHRLTLAVEFTRTGPVRAELLARRGHLSARIELARATVAARLKPQLDDLRERLAIGGRAVQVVVAVVDEDDLRSSEGLGAIGFLRQSQLMDLSA